MCSFGAPTGNLEEIIRQEKDAEKKRPSKPDAVMAAEALAKLMEGHFGSVCVSFGGHNVTTFLKKHWKAVSTYAHIIHDYNPELDLKDLRVGQRVRNKASGAYYIVVSIGGGTVSLAREHATLSNQTEWELVG